MFPFRDLNLSALHQGSNMPLTQPAQWPQAQFGHANFNDPRHTKSKVPFNPTPTYQPEPSHALLAHSLGHP